MKKLIGLVILLLILVLGSYFATGLVTERNLKQNINVMNRSRDLFVDIKSYDRGWFRSTANLEWRIHAPERMIKNQKNQSVIIPARDYNVSMPLTILHGPVMFSTKGVKFGLGYAHTILKLPEEYIKTFEEKFQKDSTKPELKIDILINYLNRSRFKLILPPFILKPKDEAVQFNWLGMENSVTTSSNMNNVRGRINVRGLILDKQTVKAEIGPVKGRYHLYQTSQGMYLGSARIALVSMTVKNKGVLALELKNFEAQTESNIDDGLFNSSVEVSLEKLYTDNKTYGPAALKISLNNLDADTLVEVNSELNKINGEPKYQRQQTLFTLLPKLPKLLSKGAEFQISKLHLVMPDGEIDGKLLVSLPGSDVANPFELFQKIEGSGKLVVPMSVVKAVMIESQRQRLMHEPELTQAIAGQLQQSPEHADDVQAQEPTVDAEHSQDLDKPLTQGSIQDKAKALADKKINGLVQSGALLRQNNNYIIELKLQNGRFTVNGQPFSPEMLNY